MIIRTSYTTVEYYTYRQDEDNPDIAHKIKGRVSIYEGRVTTACIQRMLPAGAVVDGVYRNDRKFVIDGEKALAWLIENGTEKE